QRGEETAKGKDEPATQHIPHEGKKERVAREHRDQQGDEDRRNEDDVRGEAKYPRTLHGNDFILVEEFPYVTIRLEDARSPLGLHILLQASEDPLDERG